MSAKLSSKLTHPLRLMAWGSALMLLLTPLIAMQFTDEVHWTPLDFIVMGILIGTVGLAIEKAVSLSPHTTYRIGVTILLLSLFLLTWTNLAVGIIGRDGDIHNLLYFLVPTTGFVIAKKGNFSAKSMLWCALGMSITQLFITLIAISFSLGQPYSTPMLLSMGNGLFIALYLLSASFFYYVTVQAN